MSNPVIKFKGEQEGLYIDIYGSDIELVKKLLDKKINKTSKFYQGIKFLGIRSDMLSENEILELNLLLKYKYNFDIELENIIKLEEEEKNNSKKSNSSENQGRKDSFFNEFKDQMARFIHGTLRSGQEVDYEGHVVIVGDVNPGALIKAGGNIVVVGNLRGVAYAGLDGDRNSIIVAYKLLASQLKICDIIGRAPDQKEDHYDAPEVVRLVNGELVIEPYLPNR